jgi:hypothetical protein
MQKYTILDTEMVFDRYYTEAYQEINPKCEKTRIAARKLNMIALLDISIDDLGRVSVGRLRSWTTEHQDEGAMLTSATICAPLSIGRWSPMEAQRWTPKLSN